jgi:DNA-binding LacI/PurR family transcriptional regulator
MALDYLAAARMAVAHLVELGRRRVAHHAGYADTLEERGLPLDASLLGCGSAAPDQLERHLAVKLTQDEVTYLEEPYVPHPVVGPQ